MADRTARAHVQALIGKGVLSTTRRRRGPPFYQIDYEWKASKAPAKRTQDWPATGQSKRDAKTGQFARSKTGRPPATEREGTNLPPKTPLPTKAKESRSAPSRPAPLSADRAGAEKKQPEREPFQTFSLHPVPDAMARDLEERAAHITGKSRPSFAAPVLAESVPEPGPTPDELLAEADAIERGDHPDAPRSKRMRATLAGTLRARAAKHGGGSFSRGGTSSLATEKSGSADQEPEPLRSALAK